MVMPLAPVVHGPILKSSTHVLVSGVLADAEVLLFVGNDRVGSGTASANGNLWVALDRRLSPDDEVVAAQHIDGTTSALSNYPVTVLELPVPLPAPIFGSPVTECMNYVLLAGLVPGATVTLKIDNTLLASFEALGTSGWVGFDPSPLSSDHRLSAVQTIDGASSDVAFSPPLVTSRLEVLPVPVIAGPLHACDTAVLASALLPAGLLELSNAGNTQFWPNIAETFWATGVHPLQQGKLTARQLLPGCGGESSIAEFAVGPAVTPPAPVLQPFCPDAKRVVVKGLEAGGVLTLWTKVWNQPDEEEIGTVGIGASTMQVDLPHKVGGSGDIMQIRARQTVCGLTSPPGSSLEFARPGSGALPPPNPSIVPPLLDCMRSVPADGLLNGVLTQVFSRSRGEPLSDWVVVTSPKTRIPVWFPLMEDDEVEVRQAGCSAPSATPVERVQPLPSPLPSPAIIKPVRPGDRVVRIENHLPGARVHLLVDWEERAASDQTWDREAVLQLPTGLAEDQKLWAVQTMCTQSSTYEGVPVIVSKGRLDVEVAPDTAPGGKPASFTVSTRDRDTGMLVPGLPVILGGQHVGVTGAPFGWTPPMIGNVAVGTVQGGIGFGNSAFSIAIRQAVPLALNLFPGPVAVPNTAWQTDVVWTVTPRWGEAPVVVNGNVGTAMVPPPVGGENRVSVSLAFKAHLQGEIGGIVWPYEVIEVAGYLTDVGITGTSHALSVRFWFQPVDVPLVDEDNQVTGWETKLAAGAQLFSTS